MGLGKLYRKKVSGSRVFMLFPSLSYGISRDLIL